MLNTVQHRHVAIARLSHPTNLGRTMQDLRFIIIVIAPSRAVSYPLTRPDQCFDSHRTGEHWCTPVGAVPGAVFSKSRCPVRCSVLNISKPGARCGAGCNQSRKLKHCP